MHTSTYECQIIRGSCYYLSTKKAGLICIDTVRGHFFTCTCLLKNILCTSKTRYRHALYSPCINYWNDGRNKSSSSAKNPCKYELHVRECVCADIYVSVWAHDMLLTSIWLSQNYPYLLFSRSYIAVSNPISAVAFTCSQIVSVCVSQNGMSIIIRGLSIILLF